MAFAMTREAEQHRGVGHSSLHVDADVHLGRSEGLAPSEWWTNSYNPCGGILFFSSHAEIDAWCQRHALPHGEVMDIATGVALAREWFSGYLEPTWRRKSTDEAQRVFESLGLTTGFWRR